MLPTDCLGDELHRIKIKNINIYEKLFFSKND